MNIGVIGGTFDPIHTGHLTIAEEARKHMHLAEVLFVPAGIPWLKADRPILDVEHRVEMVRLAIADKEYCKLSTVDIDRGGPTYTADTIADLQSQIGAEEIECQPDAETSAKPERHQAVTCEVVVNTEAEQEIRHPDHPRVGGRSHEGRNPLR